MITFFIYFSFIFVVLKSLKVIARLPEPEGKKQSLIFNLYVTLFLPLFIPFIFSAILTFTQNFIFSFYNNIEKTQPSSILFEIWLFALIELFVICLLAQFAGGWLHSNKKGGRDSRYRENPYLYTYSERERGIARKILTIPFIVLLLFVIFTVLKIYLEKK